MKGNYSLPSISFEKKFLRMNFRTVFLGTLYTESVHTGDYLGKSADVIIKWINTFEK